MLRLDEQVEVLRLAVDSGILVDCVGTGHDEGDTAPVERADCPLVLLALHLGDPEVTVGDRLPFFAGEVVGDGGGSGRHGRVLGVCSFGTPLLEQGSGPARRSETPGWSLPSGASRKGNPGAQHSMTRAC